VSGKRDVTMATERTEVSPTAGGIDLVTMTFLILTPIIGVVGTAVYTYSHGFHLWMPLLTLGMYMAVGISICAGYHRFFSHKSYEASRPVQVFYAVFGAMAAQNSILWWSASHRIHHKYVDREWDPYSIRRGFWWAHIVWIFYRHQPPEVETTAADLLRNPVVLWQNRWYRLILLAGGFGLPVVIGAMFGDPIGGLLWGGFLRLAVIHHTTFFVNSLAHYVGTPTYNAEVSARDNWGVALLTLGEGYHSFHHRFPADFRNGIRWYHWDPAKWFIAVLRTLGLASNLRSATPPQIERARMDAEIRDIERGLAAAQGEVPDRVRRLIADARNHLDSAFVLWQQYVNEQAHSASSVWRNTRRKARRHVREARRRWSRASDLASSTAWPTNSAYGG
jgi:stearoyl-CoA desaturase (delta-9 desaturase)